MHFIAKTKLNAESLFLTLASDDSLLSNVGILHRETDLKKMAVEKRDLTLEEPLEMPN